MSKLIKHLFYRPIWHRLPPLPRQYTSDFKPSDVDEEIATLMRQTHTRSPQGVELLMRRHDAVTPRELIETLPRRRRPRNIPGRIESLIMRALGVTRYDPMKAIARKHMRR